ncbi:hypothetical protein H8A95_21920 [Bradyrhizobium sp. Pear76]|uniref:hypothetical protein n=1 Tax=Bradyrhizobium oropedii TaxID=1571201 RepID=UPI001E2EBEDC|nr:hypothetical protein [Bradyrhizobium oropedii]MCC8964896.1 hypothetical protein [Bradyrhizobium oropedii]
MADLTEALKAACVERDITHETLNALSGLAPGYVNKLFAHQPMKNLGYQSTGDLLGALGKALILVDDYEAIKRVSSRWVPRERPRMLSRGWRQRADGALLIECGQMTLLPTTEAKDHHHAGTQRTSQPSTEAGSESRGEIAGGRGSPADGSVPRASD